MSWKTITGILIAAFAILTITVTPIVVMCSTNEIQKEANNWSRGLYSDVTIPHTVVPDALLTKEQRKIVLESVREINKQMNKTLFVYATTTPTNKKYTNIENSKQKPLLCNVLGPTYGQNERFPTFEKPTHHFVVTICFEKIKKHMNLVGYQGNREKQDMMNALKSGGAKMIVMHELLHSLIGYPVNTNQHHPAIGCDLMCSFPKSAKIGTVTKLILEQHAK